MSILDCLEQNQALVQLQLAHQTGRIPHGYIFYGPEGVGKGLLAGQWAKLLLCAEPTTRSLSSGAISGQLEKIEDSCDKCPDCRLVDSGNHPDLHMINKELVKYASVKRESKMIDLPIVVIREFVIEPAGLLPTRGRARVFIIEQAEEMNRSAQNALLKTLEEPPGSTFLILVTSKIERLLPTVRSRCQLVRFRALPKDFVEGRLIKEGVTETQAVYWADFVGGRLGLAINLAKMGFYETKQQLTEKLARLGYPTVLESAEWLSEKARQYAQDYLKDHPNHSQAQVVRQGQGQLLELISHAFSLALRVSTGNKSLYPENLEQGDLIEQIGHKFGSIGCAEAIRTTARAYGLLQANVNPTLIFESVMLNYLDYISGAGPAGSQGRQGRASEALNR